MFNAKYSKVTTSIFTTVTISFATLVNITPVQAQLFPEQNPARQREGEVPRNEPRQQIPSSGIPTNTVPQGIVIPVEYEEEKILVTPEETVPVTLLVGANIRDSNRNTLIPYGSEIIGQIQPSDDESGSFFVASEIIFPDGSSQPIDAVSQVVTRREVIEKGANTKDILQGAAIGAAAATVLSEIFGDIDALEVLGGAGAGAIAGILLGGNEAELISFDPNNDLDLTLETDLNIQ